MYYIYYIICIYIMNSFILRILLLTSFCSAVTVAPLLRLVSSYRNNENSFPREHSVPYCFI